MTRAVFVGIRCAFSPPPFRALLDAGIDVAAVIVPVAPGHDGGPGLHRLQRPAPRPAGLQMAGHREPGLVDLAHARAVPVFEVGRLRAAATVDALRSLEPDVIAVACFPRRLPASWLAAPRLGCLNVHPSLLPDNRGPEPVFWTFRRGDHETGATVHLMDAEFDAGPIVARAAMPVPDGIAGHALERRLAGIGADLLVRAVRDLNAGVADPQPQDATRATYFPAPAHADFEIRAEWTARHAYNFAAGAHAFGHPFVRLDGHEHPVSRAVDYEAGGRLDAPFRRSGHTVEFRCADGVARFRLAHG